MSITRISLDGDWDFLHAVEHYRTRPVQWRKIAVPSPWQAQFPDLRTRGGTGIYRRAFDIPVGWLTDRVYLRFGAVFHITRAWVNGVLVGMNVGGFLPFAFDVTDQLLEGTNEIKLRVDSPTDDLSMYPDTPLGEIPFGKQSWYGPLSGIWQSVCLERRVPDHVARAKISPDLRTGQVTIQAFLASPSESDCEAEIAIHGPAGARVLMAHTQLSEGTAGFVQHFALGEPLPWSPDAPNLYRLDITLMRNGIVVDQFSDSFGFRTIEARNGRFYLNGELLYLRAALDQDYYPDTICTTPSIEFLEDQFRKAKELGLNCVRCHIKAPDPMYYEVADRVGLLVWTELPNLGLSTERSQKRKQETLKGIVDRDGNHPSIFCWTIINENWGVDLVHDSDHREWLKRTYEWLKAYDPGRLIVDNSPLAPSFHIVTDIADYHFYAAFPDSREKWDKFVDDLASRSSWLFGSVDESLQTGEEPLVCSEFGNWGLPHPAQLRGPSEQEPWWFETGHDWADGVMYPHGVENRFNDWSLGRVFGDLTSFIESTQWQQFRALKYQIEIMRSKEALAGYVITEFTDVHWESNGLLDMRRNERVFHQSFRSINADTVIVPLWQRLSYWSGETAAFDLRVAHGAGADLRDAILEVKLDDSVVRPLPLQSAGKVFSLDPLLLRVPDEQKSCIRRVHLKLKSSEGKVIATNYLNLAVHAVRNGAKSEVGPVWSPDADLRHRLEELGYCVKNGRETLVVARDLQEDVARHVRDGGRLLLLAESVFSLNPLFPHWQNVRIAERAETMWAGEWASTFAWLHRGRAFSGIPGGPLLDETFD